MAEEGYIGFVMDKRQNAGCLTIGPTTLVVDFLFAPRKLTPQLGLLGLPPPA